MNNNDVLRRVRYIFDFNDSKMIAIFAVGKPENEQAISRAHISDWLKKEDDPSHKVCTDMMLATFLNGLIIEKRGVREGSIALPEKRLTNNTVFTKLKIALNFKAEDVLEVLESTGHTLSKHELSAFFRNAGHKHYRECKDQVLRNFLKGLQLKYRKATLD
jgi:uncharacterized protein YehS (DUF1456 family)